MLKYVPLDQIDVPEIKLRGARMEDPDFQDLLMSVQEYGVLEPILLREIDGDRYSLVNGLQRYTCAGMCNLDTIPARIDDQIVDETDAILKSIITNLQTVKTRPFEYANHLRLYIKRNPDMTIQDLAKRLGKAPSWLMDRLSLTNLKGNIGDQLDKGALSLKKGQGLALLPVDEQEQVLEEAGSMSANDFFDLCLERKRQSQMTKARGRQGTQNTELFHAKPVLRRRVDVIYEYETAEAGQKLLARSTRTDPTDVWDLAIAWVLQLDPISKEEREKAHNDRLMYIKSKNEGLDKNE